MRLELFGLLAFSASLAAPALFVRWAVPHLNPEGLLTGPILAVGSIAAFCLAGFVMLFIGAAAGAVPMKIY